MIEIVGTPGFGTVAVLLGISFCAFLMGLMFRKWPATVQAYVEPLDGSEWVMRPETHRGLIRSGGLALTALSFAALLAAGFLLH